MGFFVCSLLFDMWCFTVISILVVVSAYRLSPNAFACTPEGYKSYRNDERYKLFKGEEYHDEETYAAFQSTCLKMQARASYVRYQQEFSILSDFAKDTLDNLMDLSALTYSGLGSYYDGANLDDLEAQTHDVHWTTMDRVFDDAADIPYSLAKNFAGLTQDKTGYSTSWATVTIKAAEQALKNKGIDETLSWRHFYECIFSDDTDNSYKKEGVLPKDIIEFIREKGLVAERDVMSDGIDCSKEYEHTYLFNVRETEGPNKYSLMNLVHSENPTMVLMAIDLHKIKFVADMREDEYPIRCSYDEPTLYGIVTAYQNTENENKEGYWMVETNVVPGENVALRLPLVANGTNANYAGIAAYAFSITYDGPIPSTEPPTTGVPTTEPPTTEAPTTEAPTTLPPTTEAPTTEAPTTEAPTTEAPTTEAPTTEAPTTEAPTTEPPTTDPPTTEPPTTEPPTTVPPDNRITVNVMSCANLNDLMEWTENDDNGYIQFINVILPVGTVCNGVTELDFSRFFWLETLTFSVLEGSTPIDRFPDLKHVVIGNEKLKSVTLGGIDNMDQNKVIAGTSLEIKKSINLESIYISVGAFSNFETFVLGENPDENEENFPKLTSISFGNSGQREYSYSFAYSDKPFVLANLPALEEVILSQEAFFSTNSVRFENLPKLKTLYVGSEAFFGSLTTAELTMVNVGTEYYTMEIQKTDMTVALSAFNSQVNVYLKGNAFHLVLIIRYSYRYYVLWY